MRRRLVYWLVPLRNRLSGAIRRWLNQDHVSDRQLRGRLVSRDITGPGVLSLQELDTALPCSFHELINYRSGRKILADEKLPEWHLNDKIVGGRLAKACGHNVPRVYQEETSVDGIKWRDGMVIKPVPGQGSIGIYYYFHDEKIWSVYDARWLSSKQALIDELQRYCKQHSNDRWIVEQLITTMDGDAPRDIKFYSFYGEVGLVQEIDRSDGKKFCMWSTNGSIIDTGKYSSDQLFSGNGFIPEQLDEAKRLSAEIPAPFVRIDFMDVGGELVFGEFTPRPGGYDRFNQATDTMLGEMFVRAEQRLTEDLLRGKKFHAYHKTIT